MKAWKIIPDVSFIFSEKSLACYPHLYKDINNPTEDELRNFFNEYMELASSSDIWEKVVNTTFTFEKLENEESVKNSLDDIGYDDEGDGY